MQSIYRHAVWSGLNKHRSKCKVRLVIVRCGILRCLFWFPSLACLVCLRNYSTIVEAPVLVPGCPDAWTKCPSWNVLIHLFFEIYYYITRIFYISCMYIYYISCSPWEDTLEAFQSFRHIISENGCMFRSRFCFAKKKTVLSRVPALACAFTPLRLIWPCVRPVFRRTGLISNPSLLVNSFPAVAYDAEVFNDVGCLKSTLHCKLRNHLTKLVRILVWIQRFSKDFKGTTAKTLCCLYWVFNSRVLQCLQLHVNIWI